MTKTKTKYVNVLGSEVRDLKLGDKLEINGVKGFEVVSKMERYVKVNVAYTSTVKEINFGLYEKNDSHAKTVRKLVEVVEENENEKVKVDEWLYGALESLD